MEGFDGKVAVVASDIRYSIAEQLLDHNVKVAIGGLNEDRLKEIEQKFPNKVVGVKVNVTSGPTKDLRSRPPLPEINMCVSRLLSRPML